MDFVPGSKLSELLPELTMNEKYNVAIQLAQKLQAMHNLNVYHGDISPDNIMVNKTTGSIEVDLIDFGLADDTKHPKIVYFHPNSIALRFAPEVYMASCNNKELKDPQKSEIYAFGALLLIIFGEETKKKYEICRFYQHINSGEQLNKQDAILKHTKNILESSGLPPEIKPIITRMLNSDPQQRPKLDSIIKVLQDEYSKPNKT